MSSAGFTGAMPRTLLEPHCGAGVEGEVVQGGRADDLDAVDELHRLPAEHLLGGLAHVHRDAHVEGLLEHLGDAGEAAELNLCRRPGLEDREAHAPVSYTHLTLPTNKEV